jgi:hypothetical protein
MTIQNATKNRTAKLAQYFNSHYRRAYWQDSGEHSYVSHRYDQGMLVVIRRRIFCLPVCYQKIHSVQNLLSSSLLSKNTFGAEPFVFQFPIKKYIDKHIQN